MLIQKHSTEMEFARFPHEMPAWLRSAYAKASADSPRARFCKPQNQPQKSRRDTRNRREVLQRTNYLRFTTTILIGSSACRLHIRMRRQKQILDFRL
jgi:hypothetical protein